MALSHLSIVTRVPYLYSCVAELFNFKSQTVKVHQSEILYRIFTYH